MKPPKKEQLRNLNRSKTETVKNIFHRTVLNGLEKNSSKTTHSSKLFFVNSNYYIL